MGVVVRKGAGADDFGERAAKFSFDRDTGIRQGHDWRRWLIRSQVRRLLSQNKAPLTSPGASHRKF